MAASGGYWLACSGKEIYARYPLSMSKRIPQIRQFLQLFCCSRCSVVGSLGVIHMGIGVVSLMEKLGIESRVKTLMAKLSWSMLISVVRLSHLERTRTS